MVVQPDFQVLFESAPGVCLVLTPDLSIVAVSDAYLRATATKREEILGRGLFDVFPENPDDPTASGAVQLRASFDRVLRKRVSDEMAVLKYDIPRPEAEGGGYEERFWRPVNSPILGPHNEVAYIFNEVQDVTESVRLSQLTKAQEQLIQRSEALSRAMLDSVVDGIIVIDEAGMIERFNPAAERIFGWTAAEIIGRNVNTLVPEPHHAAHDGYLHRYLTTGEKKIINTTREVEGRRKDGTRFPLELNVREIQVGGLRLFAGFIRDISAQKRLQLMAAGANRSEGELAERRRAAPEAQRLAWIVQSAVDAVIGASLDGVITDWNPAAQRLFGYTADEAIGRAVSMLAPPDHVAEVADLLLRVSRGEFVGNVGTVRQRKDGTPIEVMLSISPIRDDAGAVVGISTIARDITTRRHDERTIAALHAVAYGAGHIMDAERLLALTTAQVRDAFAVDALVIYWWDEARETLRPINSPGEIGALPLVDTELRRGEGLAGVVFQERSPRIVEDYAAWPQAHPRLRGGLGSAMAVPMYVGEQIVGVLAAMAIARRSFTERDLRLLTLFAAEVAPAIAVGKLLADAQARRLEAEAWAARESVYFRANPVPGLIARRADNTFVDVNDAFVDMLGHSREELVGKSLLEVGVFADPQELMAFIGTLDGVDQARAEVTLRTRLGELRSVLPFVELTEIAGEPCLILGCVNLTEQKRAMALEQGQKVIEEANRAKAEFLANMSHELRTPLNAILGFADLLLEQLHLQNPQLRYLRNIKDAGSHLLELINDVLDLSRVEAGKLALRPEVVSLAVLLEAVTASTNSAASAKQIRFSVEAVDAPVLFLDPTRVRQILYNLLSNAVKFTPAGGMVRLRVAVEGTDLLVDVADSGIGIPAEMHGQVFGRFVRLHEGRASVPGTGLGLALTKSLVELHSGSITFESTPDQGTTFHVRLPGVRSEHVEGERLLVVEDEPHDAELVVALAAKAGLRAEVVRSLAEAREALRRNQPLGVVIDLRLPDGRGEELVRDVRKIESLRRVPVVVVTIETDPDGLLTFGVDDYLTKPIELSRLERWMEAVARDARSSAETEGDRVADPAR